MCSKISSFVCLFVLKLIVYFFVCCCFLFCSIIFLLVLLIYSHILLFVRDKVFTGLAFISDCQDKQKDFFLVCLFGILFVLFNLFVICPCIYLHFATAEYMYMYQGRHGFFQ